MRLSKDAPWNLRKCALLKWNLRGISTLKAEACVKRALQLAVSVAGGGKEQSKKGVRLWQEGTPGLGVGRGKGWGE